jgi:hypothetical protein
LIHIVVSFLVAFGLFQTSFLDEPIIVVDQPKNSHCLCGQVRFYAEDGGAGFLVSEMNSSFDRIVRSTHSGKNGYFEFPNASSKGMHYICASDPLYQTVCYKVKISKKEKGKLIVNINPK